MTFHKSKGIVMNLKTVLMIIAILAISSSSSIAGFSVFGGIMLPQEQFENVSESGMLVGAELSIPIIPTLLSAGIQGSISRSEFDFSDFPGTYEEYNANWYLGEAIGFAKLSLPLSGLYVKAGAGLTRYGIMIDDEIPFDYESETHLVGVVGAGMKFILLDISAQYHVVNWDDAPVAWEDIENYENFDKSFSYFTLTAGFGF
jgi:hypothetical protein